jgi:hypothetical protein
MTPPRDLGRLLVGPAVAAGAPLVLLAGASSSSPTFTLGVAVAGVGGSVALRLLGRAFLRPAEGGPIVAALIVVAMLAVPSPLTELLAGLSGLGLLIWVAQDPSWPAPLARALRGLVLPGLSLTLALGISIALPVARQSVGVAAVLVVVSLAALGWALARPARLSEASVS